MKRLKLIIILFLFGPVLEAQVDTSARAMTNRETELYRHIMNYRENKKLDAISMSPSLNKVALVHVRDLNLNKPSAKCGMHSWSENGPWKPVCYDLSRKGPQLMWSKPSELTSYTGNGYEIAFWTTDTAFSAEEALDTWETSSPHNAVILNLGIWKDLDWNAIGIAAEGNYAVVWFGEEADPIGSIDAKE